MRWNFARLERASLPLLCAAAVVVAASASTAPAEAAGESHDRLGRAEARLTSARGAERYAALRELASLADLIDPDRVEAAVVRAAETEPLPAVRVYAEALRAELRGRRGDEAGAAARFAALGYVGAWAFVGPFDDENRVGFGFPYQPEAELEAAIVPGRAYDGKARPVRWRIATQLREPSLELGHFVRPSSGVCVYATTIATAATATPRASAWLGFEGAVKLWVDDAVVYEEPARRGFDVERVAVPIALRAGDTRLTVKICSTSGAPRIALRLASLDGSPLPGVTYSSELAAFERAAQAAGARHAGRIPSRAAEKPQPNEVLRPEPFGPLVELQRAASRKDAAADRLEALARYLVATGGEAEGAHEARDRAARAAELAPTVDRLLLAARLAEDRNGARSWIARGSTLPESQRPAWAKAALLVADARLDRLGFTGREAVPKLEAARALDPADPTASLVLAELQTEARLPRTALGTLSRAAELLPRSTSVSRALASSLAVLGRDAEADDAAARAFALYASDAGFVVGQVERAVARRDAADAERWLRRLRTIERDGVFVASVSAKAYRALGLAERARAALDEAAALAPDEPSTLRAIADLAGESGNVDEQLRVLRKLLALYPQAKDVRAYVDTLTPAGPREGDAYAFDADALRALASRPAGKERVRVLRRSVVTRVYENGLASRFYQVAWQPLVEEAAAQARQYLTQYDADKQSLDLRVARVLRADGSTAEAVESGESAANDPSIAMYTSVRTFAVSFPRVAPGDIVEIRYRVDDVGARNEVADAFYEVEQLQGREPILSSEVVVIAPKSRTIHTFVANLPGVTAEVREESDLRTYRFVATDVPALSSEPNAPRDGERAGQLHASTFASWDEVARWYAGLARPALDVDDEVRRRAAAIAAAQADVPSRVRAVYRLATELRYVGIELGIEGIRPRRCALTIARGWGDCKDKATVIVTLLRELGIDAELVLVRTAQRGDLPPGAPPSLSAFDHAIAYVPALDLYLDGTAEGAGSTELPEPDRGAVALHVREQGATLVRLPSPPPEASTTRRKLELSLAPDGSAGLALELEVRGVRAASVRSRLASPAARRERLSKELATSLGPIEIGRDTTSLVVRDADDIERPVHVEVRGRIPAFSRKESDEWSAPCATSIDLMGNAASLVDRKTPVVLGAKFAIEEERTLRLPQGAKIVRVPSPVDVASPFGRVTIEVDAQPSRVVVRSRFVLAASRVEPADYAAFRAFAETVDAALGQRLTVRP